MESEENGDFQTPPDLAMEPMNPTANFLDDSFSGEDEPIHIMEPASDSEDNIKSSKNYVRVKLT